MSIRRIGIAAAGVGLALMGGAYAWTQQQTTAAAPAKPVATERALAPSRGDSAALAQARQNPLGERLRGVLNQNRATAGIVRQAQASEVPVLAPADPSLLSTAQFHDGDRFYMLTLERPGQIIEVYGATKAFQPAAGAPPRPVVQADAATRRRLAQQYGEAEKAGLTNVWSERTEYGHDVSFSRFGAAYSVSFICDQGNGAGCSEGDAIAFAATLTWIGGGAQ